MTLIIEAPGEVGHHPRPDRALIRGVCLARAWTKRLGSGETASVLALARENGFCNHYAAKLISLAWLAPDITEAILDGRQPLALKLATLLKHPLPLDWQEQRRLLATIG